MTEKEMKEYGLSRRQIAVVRLYLGNYSYAEIAKRLNVRLKSVDNAMYLAKKKIMSKLPDELGL